MEVFDKVCHGDVPVAPSRTSKAIYHLAASSESRAVLNMVAFEKNHIVAKGQ